MSSIVLDLQKDAYNPEVKTLDLLRKAYVVARKLKVKEFETWIDSELNGYKEDDEIPEYRELTGEVKGLNPFHGWMPVQFNEDKWADLFSKRKIAQPITSLESVVDTSKSNSLVLNFPDSIRIQLQKLMEPKVHVALFIDKSHVKGIIESVRNIVLKWSLKLEEDGIIGKELNFSEIEKETASNINYNITNFYGAINKSQIQQATKDSSQIVINEGIDISDLKNLFDLINKNIDNIRLDKKELSEIKSEIQTIKTQINSPNPKQGIIFESLKSIRNILEGVTGSIIASGLIYEISKILGF